MSKPFYRVFSISLKICLTLFIVTAFKIGEAQTVKVTGTVSAVENHKTDHIYRLFDKDLIPLKLIENKFEFNTNLNIRDTFYIESIITSAIELKDFDEYVNTIRSNKVTLKSYPYIIDSTTITLQISLNNNQLTQTGGQSSMLYQKDRMLMREYEIKGRERKMNLNQLNEWRTEQILLLINQHPEAPYARTLLNYLINSHNYKLRDEIKKTIELLEHYAKSPDATNHLWNRYHSFVLANSPKDENMLFPKVSVYESGGSFIENLLNQYNDRFLVIDFWATWCKYCIEQHPKYIEISKTYAANKKVNFISISLDKNKKDWENYTKSKPFPVDGYWLDQSNLSNKQAIDHLGITSLPRYMIINTATKKVVVLNTEINNLEKELSKLK